MPALRKGKKNLGTVCLEIAEQPAALARVLASQRDQIKEVAAALKARKPRYLLIAARGSSDNAARYAQALFGIQHGMVVALASPSLQTLYGAKLDVTDALVIGISQSGRSPDIVQALEHASSSGMPTLALTNDVESPLAHASEHVIDLCAGTEHAVAATKTYTNELMALAMLSTAWKGANTGEEWAALERVPHWVTSVLSLCRSTTTRLPALTGRSHWVTLGRGYNYCTAFELALKLKEMASIPVEPFSGADFLHGPIAMVSEGTPTILCAPSGCAMQHTREIATELAARKARRFIITDDAALGRSADLWIPLPVGVPEWLSPIAAIASGQLCALELARRLGKDPDRPRGLSKVTLTL